MKKDRNKIKQEFKLDREKSLSEATEILPKISESKFEGTVDIDILLNLKEKQLKESVKGSVSLPHKFGEDKKVVVLCEENNVEKAKKAGAVEAGLDDLVEKMLDNKVAFDVVIATPSVMPKIAKLGKVLGPKGLMPNPKNGTISENIEEAVKSFKSGKTMFKMEQGHGTIKAKVGKLSMSAEQLEENILEFLSSVAKEAKKLSSVPFKRILLKPTMGPSIKIDVSGIM